MAHTCLFRAGVASLLLAFVLPLAEAAEIRVTCEKRANRSKISVDATNLVPGEYRARVISGTNRKTSPLAVTAGDEIEFDFDSRAADVAAGATKISAGFIVDGRVTGKIINAEGRTVISDTETCRIR